MASNRDRGRASSRPTRVSIDDIQPVVLFQGYDTFTNSGRGTAVQGPSQTSDGSSSAHFQVCQSVFELQQALHVSSSIDASFGFGDVGGKASFVQSLNISNTSLTIVVYTNNATTVTSTNATFIGDPPSEMNPFYQAFGDSFLSQVVTGAEYGAVYVFYAQTIDEQSEIQATLAANGIGTSGSVSLGLQASLAQAQQQISVQQLFDQFQHGFTTFQLPTSDQVMNSALGFNANRPDAPAVVSYETTGYEHVPGMPASFSAVVATRTLYTGFGVQDGLADQYAQLSAASNAIAALQDVYETYNYTDDVTTNANGATINGNIAQLDELFQQFATDPTKTYTAPVLAGLALGEPSLNVTIGSDGPFGQPGGLPFTPLSLPGLPVIQVGPSSVMQKLRLTSFAVHGGAWVDQIISTYTSDAGTQTITAGGPGGNPSPTLDFQNDERVVCVCGQAGQQPGQFVAALEMKTTQQTLALWPPDGDGGQPFTWTAQDPTVFLGFAGQSSAFLNQLEIVTATFAPALWPTSGSATTSTRRKAIVRRQPGEAVSELSQGA